MTDSPYHSDPYHAVPLGRQGLLDELEMMTNVPTPRNVSVVGPTGSGKTLALRAFADRAMSWDRFTGVVVWDLRRHTPTTDDEFFQGLASILAEALRAGRNDLAGLLAEGTLASVQIASAELVDDDQMVLVVLDHVDRALGQEGITRGVWDNLRDLADGGALVLVSATPGSLVQYAPPDSRQSPFFNVFAGPVRVGPFSDDDLDAFLAPLESKVGPLSPPTRRAFERHSGRAPVLCSLVASALYEETVVDRATVDAAGPSVVNHPHVSRLWETLSAPEQRLLADLSTSEGSLGADTQSPDVVAGLEGRGLVRETSAKEVAPLSLIALAYASQQGGPVTDVARLFGPDADAVANTRLLLEFRLQSADGAPDDILSEALEVVKGVSNRPGRALKRLRELQEIATDLLVRAESPVPYDTVCAWQGSQGVDDWVKNKIPKGSDLTLSSHERGLALRAFEHLTDPREAGKPKTGLSHGTVELLKAMRRLGNYGVHAAEYNETVPVELATAGAFLGVELVRRLASELPTLQPVG